MYIDKDYYLNQFNGKKLSDDNITKYLLKASIKIDDLTFNRIRKKGFNNLTEFQQNNIKEAICYQAEYMLENEGLGTISSYSVLDISVNVDNSNKTIPECLEIDDTTYMLLKTTGLMYRGI